MDKLKPIFSHLRYRDWRTGMEREKANVGEVGNSYVGHGHLDNVLGIDGRAVRSGGWQLDNGVGG